MPSILVGTKMKSGLPKPKPVHSALPIPQKPTRPSALALYVKTAPAKTAKQPPKTATTASAKGQDTAKEVRARTEPEQDWTGTKAGPEQDWTGTKAGPEPDRTGTKAGPEQDWTGTKAGPEQDWTGTKAGPEQDRTGTKAGPDLGLETEVGTESGSTKVSENGGSMQIYTDWANHYLSKSGHRRLIRDLQTDVSDGVLLAQIIQVVANEKIGDIHGSPRSRSQMIENIDACLSFLAAKGVNIQGLSSEEIGNGNLKAILGLFFSLSRFKQQQQKNAPHPPHLSHLSSPHGAPSVGHKHTAHTDMQSRPSHEDTDGRRDPPPCVPDPAPGPARQS